MFFVAQEKMVNRVTEFQNPRVSHLLADSTHAAEVLKSELLAVPRSKLDGEVTAVVSLRLQEKLTEPLLDVLRTDNSSVGVRQILSENAIRSANFLGDSLSQIREARPKSDAIFLPFMQQMVLKIRRTSLLDWLSLVDTRLFSNISLSASLNPPSHPSQSKRKTTAAAKPPMGWWLDNTGLSWLHAQGFIGADQVVGVLDSGVDQLKELNGKIREFAAFDASGQVQIGKAASDAGCHGTKICGLIAEPAYGAAPGAHLAVGAVLDGPPLQEQGTLAQVAAGAEWLATIAPALSLDIANISISFPHVPLPGDPDELLLRAVRSALAQLELLDIVPVLPVGNDFAMTTNQLLGHGIAVGACDHSGAVCSFSNDCPEVIAPGGRVPCLHPALPQLKGLTRSEFDGTSLSVSLVAGTLAVLREATGRSAIDCSHALRKAAATASGYVSPHKRRGWGELDARAAYNLLVTNANLNIP